MRLDSNQRHGYLSLFVPTLVAKPHLHAIGGLPLNRGPVETTAQRFVALAEKLEEARKKRLAP